MSLCTAARLRNDEELPNLVVIPTHSQSPAVGGSIAAIAGSIAAVAAGGEVDEELSTIHLLHCKWADKLWSLGVT